MRNIPITANTYYHIYNRGNAKQTLFFEKSDYVRFLFLLLHMQSDTMFQQTNRYITKYLKHNAYGVDDNQLQQIISGRHVELINFCIMPNHFHATVRTITDDGIAKYMHRVGSAFSQYFNNKHDQTGHVFQGAYKARPIESEQDLIYLSAYIHKNPSELPQWRGTEQKYTWSSFQDYKENRWGTLLQPEVISNSFTDYTDYYTYVQQSGAKAETDLA